MSDHLRKPHRVPTLLLALLAGTSLGCTTGMGPKAVPQARLDYNQAVARSWDQQLLLNLVRLRYRDTPHFLELTSVVAQYSRTGSAAVSPLLIEGGNNEALLGLGVEVYERPTLTLTPLKGDEFVQRLLKPISATDLVLLSQSGWSIFRLMQCCVQEVLGSDGKPLRNALRAAGPTPEVLRRAEYEEFQKVAQAMRDLQLAGALRATVEIQPESKTSEDTEQEVEAEEILLRFEVHPGTEAAFASLRDALGLDTDIPTYRLVSHRSPRSGELAVVGRSLMGVLFFLSQAVEAPMDDEQNGRVTVTRDEEGRTLDWERVTGDLLRIRSTETRPPNAAVAVRYRDAWFYVDDSDLQSKSTFLLLSQLFSLQAGSSDGRSPLVTLSASGD